MKECIFCSIHGEQTDCPLCMVEQLEAENKRLRKALQALYDEQNGAPLIRDAQYWHEAMKKAEEALK